MHQEPAGSVTVWVNGPVMMPRGTRAPGFRDPDGNVVSFSRSVASAAVGRPAGRFRT